MARACNLSDERLLPEWKSAFKAVNNREPNAEEEQAQFPIWKQGYYAGFERCADAVSDPYPD